MNVQALFKNTFIVISVIICGIVGLLVGIFSSPSIPASIGFGIFMGGIFGVILDSFTGRDHQHWKKA